MLCLMQIHVYQIMAEVVLSCTLLMSLNSSSIGQDTKSPTWYKTVLVTAISNIEAYKHLTNVTLLSPAKKFSGYKSWIGLRINMVQT